MTLSVSGLSDALEALYASPGATVAACAKSWADAVGEYAKNVTPAALGESAARAALESALAVAFAANAAAPGMESAFAAYGAALAAGMSPAFVGTPPAGPVGFAASFAAVPMPATHEAAAGIYSALIHAWMIKGSAVPAGGGPSVNWS